MGETTEYRVIGKQEGRPYISVYGRSLNGARAPLAAASRWRSEGDTNVHVQKREPGGAWMEVEATSGGDED